MTTIIDMNKTVLSEDDLDYVRWAEQCIDAAVAVYGGMLEDYTALSSDWIDWRQQELRTEMEAVTAEGSTPEDWYYQMEARILNTGVAAISAAMERSDEGNLHVQEYLPRVQAERERI